MKTKNKITFDTRCLISCDLDGTLLNNKSQISDYSIKVVKKLTSLGHIFCINTARPFSACKHYWKQLGLTTPVVTHNGALIFAPEGSDFPTTNWSISKLVLKELIGDKNVRKYASDAIIGCEKRTYQYCKTSLSTKTIYKLINEFGIFTTKEIVKLNGTLKGFNDTPYSIILVPKKDDVVMDLVNAIKTKVPTLKTKLWKVEGMGIVIDVVSPNCSKSIAVKDLSTYFGIPDWRTLAFGDGSDDAEMLKDAILGFAMKNGTNEAQMSASYVTQWTNDQDGVARTLNKVLKLNVPYKK